MDRPPGFAEASRLATTVKLELAGAVSDVYLDLGDDIQGVTGILYDAFVFRIGIEQPRGNLAAGIVLEGGRILTAPFGQRFTLNADDASITGVLRQMDDWARTRLPDKYLARFEQSAGADPEPAPTPSDALEYFAQVTFRDGVRVPVRVFKVDGGVDQVYRDARAGWVPDEDGILREDRMGVRDHEIWPITRLQAGQAISMIESGEYRPLNIPGLFD